MDVNGIATCSISYTPDNGGNIDNLNSMDFSYGENGYSPYALTSVTNLTKPEQVIEYTTFNKIKQIRQNSDSYDIIYGPSQARLKSIKKFNGATEIKYYSLLYEKTISKGSIKELNYIYSPDGLVAIYNSSSNEMNYIIKDNLGSILGVIDVDGNVIKSSLASFDVWGNRRDPANWQNSNNLPDLYFGRGFTGHEHIEGFKLINMNGRVYDPQVARFLSTDVIRNQSESPQSFNRYSYCLNNPLKYVDLNGYEWGDYYEYDYDYDQDYSDPRPWNPDWPRWTLSDTWLDDLFDVFHGFSYIDEGITTQDFYDETIQDQDVNIYEEASEPDDPPKGGRPERQWGYFPAMLYSADAKKGDVYVSDNNVLDVFSQSCTPKGLPISTYGLYIYELVRSAANKPGLHPLY